MTRCRYCAQGVKESDDTPAGRESQNCSRAEDGENCGQFGTEDEKEPRVEGAGKVEGEALTEETVPESCLVFAEIALQPRNIGARHEVESIIRPVLYDSFDAGNLFRHVKKTDDCKRILHSNRSENPGEEGLIREIVRSGSDLSPIWSSAVLEESFSGSTETNGDGLVGERAVSLQDVPEGTGQTSGTLYSQMTHRKLEERVMASKSRDVWQNGKTSGLPRSIEELIQIYFDETETSLKFSTLLAY